MLRLVDCLIEPSIAPMGSRTTATTRPWRRRHPHRHAAAVVVVYLVTLHAMVTCSVVAAPLQHHTCQQRHGGDTKTVPASFVNDDFCDCIDGSDEPLTGACAGRRESRQRFVCVGAPSTSVAKSFVNDGICDCCDGSDESGSVRCNNTCTDHFASLIPCLLYTSPSPRDRG